MTMMNVLEAIQNRRSIRRFTDTPVPRDMIETVLEAAIAAPSGKNRQPWQFVVITEQNKAEMLRLMDDGIAANPESAKWVQFTRDIMAQAPVNIFVFNPNGEYPWRSIPTKQRFQELVDIQSVGAAIENMILAAEGLGLGTLWICDVFENYDGFSAWIGNQKQLIAAVSLGYPDEHPDKRGRKGLDKVVTWM